MEELMKMLIKNRLLDFSSLLLLSYRHLKLNEAEVVALLLVMQLEKAGERAINPVTLANYMSLSVKEVDHLVMGLVNKKCLAIQETTLSSEPIKERLLLTQEEKTTQQQKQQRANNLVELFEHEFGRALTPIELETLREWKQCGYADEMIYEALKEATLSHVHNMRYINKILVEWAKHGMRRSGREKIERNQPVEEVEDYPWWDEF